jgi:Lrp/AsnC family leucine-responsive transcriptional regulator
MAQVAFEVLDDISLKILAELQADGRISLTELGRRVALTAPAVGERVRRLEQAGVIEGYTARVSPRALGLGLTAFVRLRLPTNVASRKAESRLAEHPEILEAHHITGDDCFLLKVVVRDASALEEFINKIGDLGTTTTSIALSSPLDARPVTPP